jgi:hypothetical protein
MTDAQIHMGMVAIRQLLADGTTIQQHSIGGYTVTKKNGTSYCVDLEGGIIEECDCPAIRECKHIKATRILGALVI